MAWGARSSLRVPPNRRVLSRPQRVQDTGRVSSPAACAACCFHDRPHDVLTATEVCREFTAAVRTPEAPPTLLTGSSFPAQSLNTSA